MTIIKKKGILLGVLSLSLQALGQTTVGTASSTATVDPAQSTLEAYQQEQEELGQSFNDLLAQGATAQQIQAWMQQNQAALASQQQQAMDMAADSALEPQPEVGQPNIPANASATLTAFLTTQATLANAQAQIHNQLLSALPQEVTDEQVSQMQQQEEQLFVQQNGGNLQLQAQQAQTLAQESAATPIPIPPPLQLPPGASANMVAFLTLRDQLARGQVQMLNQQVNATAADRDAALQQWLQQNANLIQQMQSLGEALTPSTTQN